MDGRRKGAIWIGRLVIAASLALAGASPISPAAAAGLIGTQADGTAVTAAHLDNRADGSDLSFTLSQSVEPTVFTLSGPDRVIVDLPQVAFRIDPASIDPARIREGTVEPPAPNTAADARRHHRHVRSGEPGLIASVRFGLLAAGRSRVVIGLAEPARVVSAKVERNASEIPVLTLRLARTDRTSFETATHGSQAAATLVAAPVAPREAPAIGRVAARPVIVIDPGHGGPDNGAERNGIVEKELTLAFARSLAARLEASGRYSIVLTRSADVFIPLSERVGIARRAGAALMISVHADTLPDASRDASDVSGVTVYTVSDRASDTYAATVAAKENAADAAAGIAGQADTGDVHDILFDLTRQETRAYSHVFARTLVNYWKVVGRLNRNPQRSAGFVVLKAPDVPSVLVELGYLSSTADAAAFQSEEWRDKATGRMAEAVEAYFAGQHALPPPQLSAGLVEPK